MESVGLAFCDGMGKARWMANEPRGAGVFKLCSVVCALSIRSSNLGGRSLMRSVVRVLYRNITSDQNCRPRRIPDYSISRKHIVRMALTLEKTGNPPIAFPFIYYSCLCFYFSISQFLPTIFQSPTNHSSEIFNPLVCLLDTLPTPHPKINTSTQIRFLHSLHIRISLDHIPPSLLQHHPSGTNIPFPTSALPVRINKPARHRTQIQSRRSIRSETMDHPRAGGRQVLECSQFVVEVRAFAFGAIFDYDDARR